MKDTKTTERTLRSFQAVTDYLLTGKAPAGVRREVMESLADLIAEWPEPFAPKLSGYRFKAIRCGKVVCFTDDLATARRHGKVIALFLRVVK